MITANLLGNMTSVRNSEILKGQRQTSHYRNLQDLAVGIV